MKIQGSITCLLHGKTEVVLTLHSRCGGKCSGDSELFAESLIIGLKPKNLNLCQRLRKTLSHKIETYFG